MNGLPSAPSGSHSPAGNTATGWLKVIALLFMFIDHAGKMLFGNMAELRILGRIAFPLYVWCMIVGFHYTRNVARYCLRVLAVGLVSQPLYILALNHTWKEPNIFLTLLLGLLALWGIRERKYYSHLWAPVLCIAAAGLLHADYGWRGVLLFILLYAAQDRRSAIAAVMVAFFLFWGSSYGVTQSLFGITLNLNLLPACLSQPIGAFLRLETYALLALPLMLIRFPSDLHLPRWAGYAIYPLHLILLYLLELLKPLI